MSETNYIILEPRTFSLVRVICQRNHTGFSLHQKLLSLLISIFSPACGIRMKYEMSNQGASLGRTTKLIHINSGRVKPFSIDATPPYVAVSHVWADGLFAASRSFHNMKGRGHVDSLSSTEYKNIEYCWIDTLSIDQEDPEDKQRQIPLMGDIYGNAEVVAITVTDSFGISQADIDAVVKSVEGAVEMSINGTIIEDGGKWFKSREYRRRLVKAMDGLELFTRSSWGTRVWTMQ